MSRYEDLTRRLRQVVESGLGDPVVRGLEAFLDALLDDPGKPQPACTCDPSPDTQHRGHCAANGPCTRHVWVAMRGGSDPSAMLCGVCGEPCPAEPGEGWTDEPPAPANPYSLGSECPSGLWHVPCLFRGMDGRPVFGDSGYVFTCEDCGTFLS